TGLGFSNGALTYGSAIDRTIVYLITVTYQNYKASCSVVVNGPNPLNLPVSAYFPKNIDSDATSFYLYNKSGYTIPANYYIYFSVAFQGGRTYGGEYTFAVSNCSKISFYGYQVSGSNFGTFSLVVRLSSALTHTSYITLGKNSHGPYGVYWFTGYASPYY
ncbi:MAG: hypothetical protein LBC33_01790, partial [Mycoplasmataceae bacterium]|nr:hypothetical protein [Mycoplasmataceae bacterium]